MKQFLISLLVTCLIQVPALYGQGTGIDLKKFRGGSLNFEFFMSNWLLTGIGLKSSSMGGAFSSFNPNAEDLFNNPAGIAYMKKAGLMLEMSPRLPVSLTGVMSTFGYDVEELIQEAEIVFIKQTDIINPVLEHGNAFNTEAKSKTTVFIRIVTYHL